MLLSERLVNALVLKAYTIGLLSYINMIREREIEFDTVNLNIVRMLLYQHLLIFSLIYNCL